MHLQWCLQQAVTWGQVPSLKLAVRGSTCVGDSLERRRLCSRCVWRMTVACHPRRAQHHAIGSLLRRLRLRLSSGRAPHQLLPSNRSVTWKRTRSWSGSSCCSRRPRRVRSQIEVHDWVASLRLVHEAQWKVWRQRFSVDSRWTLSPGGKLDVQFAKEVQAPVKVCAMKQVLGKLHGMCALIYLASSWFSTRKY